MKSGENAKMAASAKENISENMKAKKSAMKAAEIEAGVAKIIENRRGGMARSSEAKNNK
jgi:hypothetical protein